MIRRRLLISGRVQGVWFRDAMRTEADRLGVAGWVTNRPGGDVEAEVEGDSSQVEQLLAWAHRGPPRAEVTGVEVTEVDAVGGEGFQVR